MYTPDVPSIQDIQRLRFQARKLAKEAGLKITLSGDGLFRLEGQDQLMSAGQIISLLGPITSDE